MFCSSQLVLGRIGLLKNKQSILLKQRSGILNQNIGLSYCTSKHIRERLRPLYGQLLSPHMKSFDIVQPKHRSKVIDCIDLLANRVNQHCMGTSGNGQRDAGEAGTSAYVQNDVLRAYLRRDKGKGHKRVQAMQDKAFSGLCDPRKVDDFILLYNKVQMSNHKTNLLHRQNNAIVTRILKEPLFKVSSKFTVQNMPPAKNSRHKKFCHIRKGRVRNSPSLENSLCSWSYLTAVTTTRRLGSSPSE